MTSVAIDGAKIDDSVTFHEVFKQTLRFPDFYGRNMDAWIDCMSDLHGMSELQLPECESLELRISGFRALSKRCPGVVRELLECTAIVNGRYHNSGKEIRIVVTAL